MNVSKMAGQIALWQLLDHALGSPNQSTVDFGLLKDFLLQFLAATNQAEFIVNAKGKPNALSQDRQDTANIDKETDRKNSDDHVEVSVDDEKIPENNEKSDSRIAKLEIQQANLRKNHDDISHRLAKIEQDASKLYSTFQPLERLPSGAELLSNRKSLVHSLTLADDNADTSAANSKGGVANEGGGSGEKYLTSSWNTVRVNKRLQALEDGVDKLFAMLDILTAGQNELRSRKETKTVDNGDLSKLKEDIDQLRKGGNDQGDLDLMKGDIDKKLVSMNERLGSIESMLSKIDELERKLGVALESNSSLHKKLNMLEAKYNAGNANAEDEASKVQERWRDEMDENALKNALLEIEDLKRKGRQEEFQTIAMKLAEDLNKVKETLAGFVVRQEIEDMVRWPQLEDALNVRGFAKGKDGVDGADRDGNQNVLHLDKEEADEAGNEYANAKKEDEEDAKELKELITVEDVGKDEEKEPNTAFHPSPEMIECLQRISDLASTFGAFESRFNATMASNDSREKTIVELKKDMEGLNDLTSSINQLADHNKSLIDQTRADLNQFMQEFYDRADEDELNGIKEHLIELENMGGRTSLALNDLSSGIYNELKAKQKLIDALYECVDGLQRNKVDVGNAKSIFDLEAYKNALDSKVSMNDFDEMMMALNANLQDVLQKLDKFTSEEESLKDALDKLSSNMKDKLDAKAEESLKKYLESRIAELQRSRENLVSTAGRDIITNAAGFRRPLSTLFHCISCNRPVHLDGRDNYSFMSYRRRANSNRELAKNDSTSRTALIALQGDKKSKRDLSKDPFAVERCCGGNYTSFMQNPRKQLKGSSNQKDSEMPANARELLAQRKREKTIVNYLLGTDGHVYRGRYKMTDLRQSQYQSGNEGRLRTRSAEVGRSAKADQGHYNGTMSNPVSLASTPRTLPPIGQEVLGVKTSQIMDRYDFSQGKPHTSNGGSKF